MREQILTFKLVMTSRTIQKAVLTSRSIQKAVLTSRTIQKSVLTGRIRYTILTSTTQCGIFSTVFETLLAAVRAVGSKTVELFGRSVGCRWLCEAGPVAELLVLLVLTQWGVLMASLAGIEELERRQGREKRGVTL